MMARLLEGVSARSLVLLGLFLAALLLGAAFANLTRGDGDAFLAIAPRVPIRTEIERFALADANDALARLRRGDIQGAAVLHP